MAGRSGRPAVERQRHQVSRLGVAPDVDGEVAEVNTDIEESPGLINDDPYGAGWLFKVTLPASAAGELPPGLMSSADYEELIAAEE